MPLLPMLGDPNANRSLIQWVGWAGQWPEGRTPTPKPSRKKERATHPHDGAAPTSHLTTPPPDTTHKHTTGEKEDRTEYQMQ